MNAHAMVLAGLAGLAAFSASEAHSAALMVAAVQRDGLTINLPAVGPVKLTPPPGESDTLSLPASAKKIRDQMHVNAILVGGIVVVAVLALAPR